HSLMTPLSPGDLRTAPTRRSSDLDTFLWVHSGRALQQKEAVPGIFVRQKVRERCVDARQPVTSPYATAATGRTEQRCAQLAMARSEEHTSELQSREKHVCRLLLEK